MNIAWDEEMKHDGLTASVDSTIVTVAQTLQPRIILPKFMYLLPIET